MQASLPKILPPHTTAADWPRRRRQLLALFEQNVFGRTPEPCRVEWEQVYSRPALEGRAIQQLYKVALSTQRGRAELELVVVLPVSDAPVPVVLLLCNANKTPVGGSAPDAQTMAAMLEKAPEPWRSQVESMMNRYKNSPPPPERLLDLEKDQATGYWPVEEIVGQGYGAAAFYASEAQLDDRLRFPSGVGRLFADPGTPRPADDWGALGIWAYAASRMVDVLAANPRVDAGRISVAGHSRGGKAALWCAAQDERIRGVLVNNSGCTGAAISRGKKGENVAFINAMFPHWFCPRYAEYAWREEQLPLDQHMLLACVAPRLCYVTSGTQDGWSDPDAEWQGVRQAACAWEPFEPVELPQEPPAAGCPLDEFSIGYHRREGGHDLTRWDWQQFLQFLQRHRG